MPTYSPRWGFDRTLLIHVSQAREVLSQNHDYDPRGYIQSFDHNTCRGNYWSNHPTLYTHGGGGGGGIGAHIDRCMTLHKLL